MYFPKRITGPTVMPVSLADVKEHLNIDFSDRDPWLEFAIRTAREYVEWRLGKTLMQTTWEIVGDRFPTSGCALVLPYASPLLSVSSVKYTDSGNVVNTWATANYLVNTDAEPGLITPIYGGTWPDYTPSPSGSVRVRYVAGLSETASPLVYPDDTVVAAIKLLCGGLWENRESEVVTDKAFLTDVSIKYGVEAFLSLAKRNYVF